MQKHVFLLTLLVVTAGCLGNTPETSSSQSETTQLSCTGGHTGPGNGTVHTVNITSDGFQPPEITIQNGDSIRFVNRDTDKHWPASDVHPTHTEYPGSGINKCGSSERQCIFDACHGLTQGESFTYTFSESGTWPYHDHMNVQVKGTITVQQEQ